MAANPKRNATVKAEVAAADQRRAAAKSALAGMDAYLTINNPNSNQQRDQITLLTQAVQSLIRGVIGG